MLSAHILLKLVHVVFAMIAFGFTTASGILMANSPRAPEMRAVALTLVARLQRISSGALHVLLLTGVLMGWTADLWAKHWFRTSLLLTVALVALSMAVAKPALRRQLELLTQPPQSPSPSPSDELERLEARSRKVGIAITLVSLALVVMMVAKPG